MEYKLASKSTKQGLTDEALLALSLEDPRQFSHLVERYEPAFLRRARKIVGPREEAADIVVETFAKIYFNAHRFRSISGASFRSWAYRILTNTAIDYYVKLKARRGEVREAEFEPTLIPDAREEVRLKRLELKDEVAACLRLLPRSMSRILKLFFFEDRSQAEIARIEGISVGAVKTRLHRAKAAFKKCSPIYRV